jgi:hypothetical protein
MSADKKAVIGTQLAKVAVISDSSKPQPFVLTIDAVVVNPRSPVSAEKKPKSKREPRVDSGPSRPAVKEQQNGPDEPPLTVERDAKTRGLVIVVNTTSRYLEQALANNTPENEPAVRFVYTYGLALVAMGLIDKERTHPEWTDNEAACRERIAATASGVARVIVPLCLSLPKNLPRLT